MTTDQIRPRTLLFAATDTFQLRTLVLPVVPSLVERGWRVHLASAGTLDVAIPGVTHSSLSMTRRISPAEDVVALLRWLQLIRRLGPDMLVSGSPKASLLSITAARLLGVRSRVYVVRGLRWESERGARRRILIAMEAATLASATKSIAVSRSVRDTVTSNIKRADPPVVLGRGGSKGVNLRTFRFRSAPEELFQPPRIGFLGRLSYDKGIHELIETFNLVRASIPDVELAMFGPEDIGQPVSGELMDEIRMDSAITWRGETHDAAAALSGCTLLLFPSAREGLPNAVLEASACGLPIVAWDVPGVRDAVMHGVTGVLVPPHDTSAMAEAVIALLRDPATCRRMGQAGRTMVEEHFSDEAVVGRFGDFLEHQVAESSASPTPRTSHSSKKPPRTHWLAHD